MEGKVIKYVKQGVPALVIVIACPHPLGSCLWKSDLQQSDGWVRHVSLTAAWWCWSGKVGRQKIETCSRGICHGTGEGCWAEGRSTVDWKASACLVKGLERNGERWQSDKRTATLASLLDEMKECEIYIGSSKGAQTEVILGTRTDDPAGSSRTGRPISAVVISLMGVRQPELTMSETRRSPDRNTVQAQFLP